jgi:integrase
MAYAERRNQKLTGRWICDAEFKHSDGSSTRWHKAFASKGEAEGAEAYYRATGTQPAGMASAPTTSFAAVAERFKQRNPEWFNAHDGRTNTQRLERVVEVLGALDIKMVRHAQLEGLVDHLRTRAGRYDKPVANRTLIRYVDAAFKVLTYAHKLELIPGVPARPEIKNTGAVRVALTWQQERMILQEMEAAGETLDAFYVRLLAATGMRCGELDGLTAAQVELPEQRENTGVMLTEEQTKTNAARWVPIVPEAARKLKALKATASLPDRAQVYESFKRAAHRLGEGSSLTLHCLRHTTVTRLLEAGADSLDVAALLGHSHALMTKRYYHPDRARLFSVAEKVQLQFGETPTSAVVVSLLSLQKSA